MPITEHQRERRRRHLGSSDAAAIFGLNPWRSRYDVYLEKVHELEPSKPGEAAELGNMIEDGLLDWAAAELGVRIVKNQFRVHEGRILSASHDALVVDQAVGLEAKTHGLLGPSSEDWGDSGTDEVPAHVLLQAQHQMEVSGLSRVYIPALIGGRGRRLYIVDRNEAICSVLLEGLTRFWTEHVVPKVPPSAEEEPPQIETLRRLRRQPNSTVEIPEELVEAWLSAKAHLKAAKELEEQAEARLLAAFGEAEGGTCRLGSLTYLGSSRRQLDGKKLKEAHPEIYNEFERQISVSPTLRFKAYKETSR
jgi:putative phage-type endonuclease